MQPKSQKLTNFYCIHCGRLLFQYVLTGVLVIKIRCRRCGNSVDASVRKNGEV